MSLEGLHNLETLHWKAKLWRNQAHKWHKKAVLHYDIACSAPKPVWMHTRKALRWAFRSELLGPKTPNALIISRNNWNSVCQSTHFFVMCGPKERIKIFSLLKYYISTCNNCGANVSTQSRGPNPTAAVNQWTELLHCWVGIKWNGNGNNYRERGAWKGRR